MTHNNIWASELKYWADDNPAIKVEESILFDMDAVETYAIIHKGEKNGKVSENRDDTSTPT